MKIKAIYDNGGISLDRYTIVTTERRVLVGHKRKYLYDCISSSENGLGVFMWTECMLGIHLGKKVELEDLPIDLQNKIKNALL